MITLKIMVHMIYKILLEDKYWSNYKKGCFKCVFAHVETTFFIIAFLIRFQEV